MGKHSKAKTPTRAEPPAKAETRRKSRRKKRAHRRSWWSGPVTTVMGGILFVLVAALFMSIAQYRDFRVMRAAVETDRFYPGITVDGQELKDKTLQEALGEWAARDEVKKRAYQVELNIGEDHWLLTSADAGYQSDYADVLKSAWSVGRYGTLSQRYDAVSKVAGAWARSYEVQAGPDRDVWAQRLDEIAQAASEPGTAAKITGFDVASKGFSFEEGVEGLAVDAKELRDAVAEKVKSGGGALTLERRVVRPAQTVEALKRSFGMVTSTKTSAKSSSGNRMVNLRLACEAINGLRIEPGAVFSFNETLGKRTTQKGYKRAPAVSGGTHTMEVGGGICQVATTLFNTVAKAGHQIVKRSPHTIPSTYVPRGLDATINWPNQDFQFRNTSDYPIYLSAGVTRDKQVIVELHGKKLDEGVSFKLKGETNSTRSPGEPKYVVAADLPTGMTRVKEAKRSGYQVTTYRIMVKDGKEVERERLFKSNYPSFGGIIEVGG